MRICFEVDMCGLSHRHRASDYLHAVDLGIALLDVIFWEAIKV